MGNPGNPDRSGDAGFTAVELVFVVVILAVLLSLAFPAYQRVVMERRVQNTTREVTADVRVAQQAAVAKSAEAKCVGVAFESNRVGVYVVPQDATFSCTNPSASGLQAYGVLLSSQEYPSGVTVDPEPGDALAFVPSGVPYPTCSGDNCTAFSVAVSGGGHTRYVCVNAAGLVTVPPPGGQCP